MRRRKPEPEPRFEFTEVITMEFLRSGLSEEIPRGRVLQRDHPLVKVHPEFFRLLGPRPDAEEVS